MNQSINQSIDRSIAQVAAVELQPSRIRCNCLSIGWTVTANEAKEQAQSFRDRQTQEKQRATRRSEENEGEEGDEEEQEGDWLSEAEATQRIGRLLRPEDIAATVGHLLSDAATMVTGSVWDVSPEWVQGTLPSGIGD